MTSTANFLVATRLARVLGETYRSSEAALKELVDNAWDADASCVWISLPAPLSADAVIVRDNGSGMTSQEMRGEYLNVASDKRTRSGERTRRFKRRIKGRKGIGKFAGLMIASRMEIRSMARGRICTLIVDKKSLLENQGDIESVPLPFSDEPAAESTSGTTVILTDLDSRLNFPNPDKLREALVYEYGHDQQFTIFVNEVPLSVDDIPGSTVTEITDVPDAGETRLQFTVADGKRLPRAPGIVIKVDGKTVGRPSLFGLESDDEIPPSILRRVYGEVELSGVEGFVTADWSAIIENSKSFQNVENFVRGVVKKSISETYSREINLQKARLKQQIHRRLSALPEFRRQYAEDALLRILQKFYGESEERMAAIAMVALDAMEQDAHWAVLQAIHAASDGDVSAFAASLEQFGLVELASIGRQTLHRLKFLDFLDQLIQDSRTKEIDTHKAIESNLWLLGRSYATIASNKTLKNIIQNYCDKNFSGKRAGKRPDLLLAQNYTDSFLLIEFKRPSHSISRDDLAQAEKYRDDLSPSLHTSGPIEIMMIGQGRAPALNPSNLAHLVSIKSYASIISSARNELTWLLDSLQA